MISNNEELFSQFREVHDKFLEESDKYRKEFNEIGEQVVELIREGIDELCRTSEGAGFSRYSSNLSEKFWNEVRSEFPAIDEVGVEVE